MENFTEDNTPILDLTPKPKYFIKGFIFVLVGFILLFSSFYFLISAPRNFPVGGVFSIGDGASLHGISLKLKREHIIQSRIVFEALIILNGGEKHIFSADYLFENKLSVFEVARRISKGERHLAPVKLTIPEGFTILDIANAAVMKLPNFNKSKFLLDTKGKEGYLFPDTYFFFTTASGDDILKSMSDNFEKKLAPILKDIKTQSKNEKDIITMASVIEKEAKGDQDRALIAGILWRRLSIGMALQVDAAPETYRNRGLPVAPICNPGLQAIRAALYPTNSSYLYYLHDKDGVVHFAKTFAEHKLNKLKYLK